LKIGSFFNKYRHSGGGRNPDRFHGHVTRYIREFSINLIDKKLSGVESFNIPFTKITTLNITLPGFQPPPE
jgi:hypothetical protein